MATAQHFDLFTISATTRNTIIVYWALAKAKRRHGIVPVNKTVFGSCDFLFVNRFLFSMKIELSVYTSIVPIIKSFQTNGAASCSEFALQLLRLLSINSRQFASLLRVLPALSSISVFAPL